MHTTNCCLIGIETISCLLYAHFFNRSMRQQRFIRYQSQSLLYNILYCYICPVVDPIRFIDTGAGLSTAHFEVIMASPLNEITSSPSGLQSLNFSRIACVSVILFPLPALFYAPMVEQHANPHTSILHFFCCVFFFYIYENGINMYTCSHSVFFFYLFRSFEECALHFWLSSEMKKNMPYSNHENIKGSHTGKPKMTSYCKGVRCSSK